MKQQTAVDWLLIELNEELNYILIAQWDRIKDLIQRAKAMEKEQIIKAYYGQSFSESISNAEQYYNETYKP